jgi:hypothetical protein
MKWILCQQNQYDYVRYYSNEEQAVKSLSYKDFISFITKFSLINYQGFEDTLNRFYTIYVDLTNREWIIHEERDKDFGIEQMIALNPDKGSISTGLEEQDSSVNKLDPYKKFLTNFHDVKKKAFLSWFGK